MTRSRLTGCCCLSGPSDGSMSSAAGRQDEGQGMHAGSPHLDIFEPRPVLSGGLEAVLGKKAESLGRMPGAPPPPPNACKGVPLIMVSLRWITRRGAVIHAMDPIARGPPTCLRASYALSPVLP